MKIVHCEQGDVQWHQERAGAITASMFSEVRKVTNGLTEQQQVYVDALRAGKDETEARELAGYKSKPRLTEKVELALEGKCVGEYTMGAKDYAFRLAVERISGEPLDEGFQTWAMNRGNEMEPQARLEHEKQFALLVERTGMVKSDCGRFGASADGLIDGDGGSEYKCLIDPSRLRTVLIERDIDQFTDQVQGCMWLAEREWWHFALYCPALISIGKHLTVIEVKRDEDYIRQLEADLIAFDKFVDQCEAKIRAAEFIKPEIPVSTGDPKQLSMTGIAA